MVKSPSKSQQQQTISSFFKPQGSSSKHFQKSIDALEPAKRTANAAFVDLTTSDVEEQSPPPKRLKTLPNSHSYGSHVNAKSTLDDPFLLDPSNPLHQEDVETSVEEVRPTARNNKTIKTPERPLRVYGYSPHQNTGADEPVTPEEERAKKARREAFKRKLLASSDLLADTNTVPSSINSSSPAANDDLNINKIENIRIRDGDESVLEDSDGETSTFASTTLKAFSFTGGKGKVPSGKYTTTKRAKKDIEEVGPSGQTYTPLEKQVIALKKKYPDAILMIEVGYKYRFFGDDARIASELLNIAHFPDRNFLTAGIPAHRRDIHLKRLLSHGYKVGVVGQIETAALKKVSDNRNNPFERELTHMYTAATYIDELDAEDDSRTIPPVFMCIAEGMLGGMGVDERVSISLVAVTPSTGDVIWDEFEDGFMRSELETRLAHVRPSELLLSQHKSSKITEKILGHHSKEASSKEVARDRIRLERYKKDASYTEAFQNLKEFYSQKCSRNASENFKSGRLLATISDLPRRVVIALSHSLDYLKSFDLAEVLTQTQFFTKFTERQHMLLNANTLSNLEIFRNQTDFTEKGSLIWAINRTKTKFGSRMLRSWVGRPLTDNKTLKERVEAVESIISAEEFNCRDRLLKLRELLKSLGSLDLAKGLSRIQYLKCTPKELSKLILAFVKIGDAFSPFETPDDVGFNTPILNGIIHTLPGVRGPVRKIFSNINLKMAEEDRRDELWNDPDKYPEIDDTKIAIAAVESELVDHLKTIRRILKKPAAQYITVNQDEYLIEVRKDEKRDIPVNWEVVSSLKYVRRYRTPEVRKLLQERSQYQEKLEAEANKAYLAFLTEIIDQHYVILRNAINSLATADCLFSLAELASQGDYVKPEFVERDSDVLEIMDGRHPMVELLRSDPFVPNSICIGGDTNGKTKIITGPNMGGKSSAVRMVALIALLAQIGSYVPASSVRLSPLDAILTRMGASDDLARGRSTFMVEMSETSDILHSATDRSLVVLDELGRGSSTFDGMAIAGATLEYLVEKINCKTLFITHYPVVANNAERKYPDRIKNIHMGFTEDSANDGRKVLTFLYKLTEGISSGSYGIECARLAGITEELLGKAEEKAGEMQKMVQDRGRLNRARKVMTSLQSLQSDTIEGKRNCLYALRRALEFQKTDY